MIRKKLMLLLLSGLLVFSSMPVSVFAEDSPELTPTPTEAPLPENTPTPEPDPDPTATPEPTATPAADPTATPAADPTATPAADPTATPAPTATPVPEDQIVDSYEKLVAAIEAAPVSEATTAIYVKGSFDITGTVTIPEGKKILLCSAEDSDATLRRGDIFVSDMFVVEKNAVLIIQGTEEDTLTLDGRDLEASGSLIRLEEDAKLGIGVGTVLENNNASCDGAAIQAEKAQILLLGGIIRNNKGLKGAVYTDDVIQLGSAAVEEVIVTIMDNEDVEENTADIYLAGPDAALMVKTPLEKDTEATEVSITVEDETRTDAIVYAEDGLDMEEDVLPYIILCSADYYLNAEGKLEALDTDPTPTPEPTNTPTPAPTATPVPTPTKNIKPNALKILNVAWKGRDSLEITFKNYEDVPGSAYYEIVPDGSDFTKLDTTGEGIPVSASGTVTFTIDNSEKSQVIPDGVFRVYLQVKYSDAGSTLSQIYPIKIDQSLRPVATPTPAPTTRPAKIYKAEESIVDGLSQKIPAYAKKIHFFSVTGAGSDNMEPQEGDVKWEPAFWSAGNQKHYKDKFGRFYMIFAKDYEAEKDITIQIHYTKYVYRNGAWSEVGEEAVPYTLTVYPATPEKDPELQNGSGAIANQETLEQNGIVLEGESYVADNAVTGDDNPILPLAAAGGAALLAAIAAVVLLIKRKK
ncbi:MAG: hypothetical protein KBT01_07410 [Clostridiales bacterium]|nr:hypothetical protein [Candidatus Blautia equi]